MQSQSNQSFQSQMNDDFIFNSQNEIFFHFYEDEYHQKPKLFFPLSSKHKNQGIAYNQLISTNQKNKKQTWRLLRQILKTIIRFKLAIQDVTYIKNQNELVKTFNSPCLYLRQKPLKQKAKKQEIQQEIDHEFEAIKEFREKKYFFQLISRGSQIDIQEIIRIIDSDPKKFLRSSADKEHLLNQTNEIGQTPLYVACKNGNLQVVQLFLEFKADPHIQS